jgi:hypothetical protein
MKSLTHGGFSALCDPATAWRPELPPLLANFCICTQTMDGAEGKARQYIGKFVESNFYHYELLGEHFSQVKGYDAYAQKIALAITALSPRSRSITSNPPLTAFTVTIPCGKDAFTASVSTISAAEPQS